MASIGLDNLDHQKDRRRAPRRRVLKSAQIVSLDKMSTIDCAIKSVSRTGALLSAPPMSKIPNRFYLRVPGHLKLIPCQLVRNRLTGIAVDFQADPGPLFDGRLGG